MVLLPALWIAALGLRGDSCQSTADCEEGLGCVKGECVPRQAAPVPQMPIAPQMPPGQQMPPGARPFVRVYLTSRNSVPARVSLYRGAEMGQPQASCYVPCTLEVEPGPLVVVVEGDGVRKGRANITIVQDVSLEVRPGTNSGYAGGVASTVIGTTFLTGGSLLVGLTAGSVVYGAPSGWFVLGLGATIAGLALTIIGPIVLAQSVSKVRLRGGFGFSYAPLEKGGGIGTLGFSF